MRRLMAPVLVAAVLTCLRASAADPSYQPLEEVTELRFGLMATESASGLKDRFEPFCDELSEAIGMPVRLFYAPDYAGVIEAMRFGKVHLAWCGNKSALEAVKRAHCEVFAQTTGPGGERGYHSVLIVHADAEHATLTDVLANGGSLIFGNGDPNSTSGYLVPSFYLWSARGIDPFKHFKRVVTSNHQGNLMAVAARQVDVATNNTMDLQRFREKRPDMAKDIRVIWESPLIPKDPLVWRRDLPVELKTAIKAFVLSYGRLGPEAARQKEVLANLAQGWGPFLDASNRQLLPIREIELARDLETIQNATNLSESQREDRLAAVRREMDELKRFRELLDAWY